MKSGNQYQIKDTQNATLKKPYRDIFHVILYRTISKTNRTGGEAFGYLPTRDILLLFAM